MESRIFTKAETKALQQRLEGNKKDPTGIFSRRVKPKIKEILNWFKRKEELEKTIQYKLEE